ncbi:hypothetical protein R6Q59_024858 [Mikania micrantha]
MTDQENILVDEDYSSEPIFPSCSKIIVRRKRYKKYNEDQSSSIPKTSAETPIWYIQNEESVHWSQGVLDFFHHGDDEKCYSVFFGSIELGNDFWGTVLGYYNNGYLSSMHVAGWVARLMRFRLEKLKNQEAEPITYRWTILPPHFMKLLITQNNDAASFVNGTKKLYPCLFEVDTRLWWLGVGNGGSEVVSLRLHLREWMAMVVVDIGFFVGGSG